MQSIQAGIKSKESHIQKAITDWLDLTGLEYTVTDASVSVFKDESGKKHYRGAGKVAKSWADLTVCLPVSFNGVQLVGAMLVIEVKTSEGKYQKGQKEQLDKLKRSGAFTLTARSLDDVIAFFNSHRLIFLQGVALVPELHHRRIRELLSIPPVAVLRPVQQSVL